MQQTSKYQFNLVDATDDFSPDPLNQNAEKTETLIAGVESDLAALTTAVGEGGHNCRIAFGSYQGTGTYGAGSPNSLTFDFCPVAVCVGSSQRASFSGWPTVFLRPCPVSPPDVSGGSTMAVSWSNHGISWYTTVHSDSQNNSAGYTYYYVAVGYDLNG